MLRAIYAVIEGAPGFAKIEMLGDCQANIRVYIGRDERDALGYRSEQYDELVKVAPSTLRTEQARRVALMKEMVWKGGAQ